jgi:hypothetical protein
MFQVKALASRGRLWTLANGSDQPPEQKAAGLNPAGALLSVQVRAYFWGVAKGSASLPHLIVCPKDDNIALSQHHHRRFRHISANVSGTATTICFTAGCRRSPTSRLATWFPPLNSRFAPTPFERQRVADAEPEAISIVVCVGFLTGGLRLAAILVSGLQVLVRGAAVSLGEIAGQ